ncbi:thioredoxin domain-containing protein [Methanolobus mangrovi]|uniref:Thioredoxin domain-containing protein n=1 Tax=Methanolobus mangrovi TaxID=3072977 RepID=A0AA51UHS2_9EURY|nr:thioredoxin domain-containing protein [Methanolobus mangrovi]WMW22372.1 thioredoxin domain-containing protein [Methanolobus mangrovi]
MTGVKENISGKSNNLIQEKSPYLLQHAYNPVDWYPWGEEAFKKAREENKPIFLSIGYSTCHWCHVMEKESFENNSVAQLLNESFVSIKVDREERPDIDNIYMSVCQALTGSGGWPLTILMTPDKKPFYAATYIPRESRYGIPGMLEIIPAIRDLWINKKEELLNSADAITSAVSSTGKNEQGININEELLKRAFVQLSDTFDTVHAGFGRAPKFPTPHHLTFLLRYWKRTGNANALEMVERTLSAMRMGGIFDQIGFGFHRYSTDSQWLVPHFEKMLYNQALMIIALAEAYQAIADTEYKTTAKEILTYLKRDMISPEGGFYSAEDADSEGEEGKFYLWATEDIEEILGKDDATLFKNIFNIQDEGNFTEEHTKQFTGKNIPHMTETMRIFTSKNADRMEDIAASVERSRQKLFIERERRIHPSKDDKMLTDWNGLTIVALCKAAQAFGETEYATIAENAADFFMKEMTDVDGKMKHRYRDGEAAIDAFLEDYAFFIWGLIELYQTNFDSKYLEHALKLNNYLITHFNDNENGGFFHTSDEAEELIFRSKEVYDGAIPSGNSVCVLNLLKLAKITADTKLESIAHRTIQAFSQKVNATPIGYTQFMSALDFDMRDSLEIVIVGNQEDTDTGDITSFINERFIPGKILLLKTEKEDDRLSDFAVYTKEMEMIDGKTTVHICQNHNCKLPSNDMDKIKEQIETLS